ncbi:hypothetical protein BDP27DRAFT_1320669 [Rhodocollybia butyracea]|uniref:Uncharacterized protein n=1 Tax=Rhodocollybia butyracea TaxID=206335 RepID=A0A9P5UAQ3_9AGAR|nr:hypothetical protein BDP27DRAFT_1320669 [Rhodocollybia butyracea]
MQRYLSKVLIKKILRLPASMRLVNNTAQWGQVAFPKDENSQVKLGFHFDFAGKVMKDGIIYNKYKMQFSDGDIPPVLKSWRTVFKKHGYLVNVYIKDGGTAVDIEQGLRTAVETASTFQNLNGAEALEAQKRAAEEEARTRTVVE